MHEISRFRALPVERRRRLFSTVGLLVACRVTLAVGSTGQAQRLLERLAPTRGAESTSPGDIAWAVETATTLLPGTGTCLPAALVATRLLAAHGHEATLHLGVAPTADGIDAHAWVEHDGDVLVGDLPDLARFHPLPDAALAPP